MRASPDLDSVPTGPNEPLKRLARCFVLVPDLSATDDPINLLDPHDYRIPKSPDLPTPDKVRCLCDSNRIDEPIIQCDVCRAWMHVECLHLINPGEVIPFICICCQQKVSNAVRGYVRAQLQSLKKADPAQDLSTFWTETLAVIEEVKEMLHLVPLFLKPHI
jgi:hypothetical protein